MIKKIIAEKVSGWCFTGVLGDCEIMRCYDFVMNFILRPRGYHRSRIFVLIEPMIIGVDLTILPIPTSCKDVFSIVGTWARTTYEFVQHGQY